jgi:starch synthase
MYSLRYGTLPVVRAVGGLADTVVDADEKAIADGSATGFVFRLPTAEDFLAAVRRACLLWREPDRWRGLQLRGMAQDFSWHQSAERYRALYREAINLER